MAAGLHAAAAMVAENVTVAIQSGLLANTMDTAHRASKIFSATLEQHVCSVSSIHTDAAAAVGHALRRNLKQVLSQHASPEAMLEEIEQRGAAFTATFAHTVATRVTADVSDIHSVISQAFTKCLKGVADVPAVDTRAITTFLTGNIKESFETVVSKYLPSVAAATSSLDRETSTTCSSNATFLDRLEDLTRTLNAVVDRYPAPARPP